MGSSADTVAKISLPDFFKYYEGTVEQKEAVVLLESLMPTELLSTAPLGGQVQGEASAASSTACRPVAITKDRGPHHGLLSGEPP